MGNSEEAKSCKPEKTSSPAPDQTNFQVYPDWAAMQAYYGHRVAVPPYFNSAVASGHAPHPYMWGPPQPMMPPYGAPPPYAAIYAHGGICSHPGVPLATPLSMDTPAKSSGNTDQGLMKKLKGFEGLAMPIGNDNVDSAEGGSDHGLSQSGTGETEGSSDGSDGNTTAVGQNVGKSNIVAGDGKTQTQSGPVPPGEINRSYNKVMGLTVAPSMTMELELSNPPVVKAKTSPTSVQQPCMVTPNESWFHKERELKREKRKQSNRESARRSRLRKQAEAEELAIKVESLTAKNIALKSEFNGLTEDSEKLKLENAKLMAKMKISQLGQTEGANHDKKMLPLCTANLLSRVNNSGSIDGNDGDDEIFKKNSAGAKLHQLLDANVRTDAMTAG